MRKMMAGAWLGAAFLCTSILAASAADYFPPKGDAWAKHTPQQEGIDPVKMQQAIDYAISAEIAYPPELAKVADVRDLTTAVPMKYANEVMNSPLGPLKKHAPARFPMI